MHHEVPWSFHYIWVHGWELYGVVFDVRYTIFLANSHFYFFEMGRRMGLIVGKLIVFLDFTFDFHVITPTKKWNRIDPGYD
jgi:hypothetical protein